MSDLYARRLLVTGRVQGVGFRPFVSRMAHEFGLTGWVRNRSGRVDIWVEGAAQALDDFENALTKRAPPLARPEPPHAYPETPSGFPGFTIEDSETGATSDAHIPPDYFVCDDCLAEMKNPAERRFRYPFINCTQCGPRYTLIDRLPYDRPNTAMAGFALCPACDAEYRNPTDRRYHAQPLACARCGPALTFRRPGHADIHGDETALGACLKTLRAGLIVAVKGVGGYHLLCDAGDSGAVQRLRTRKSRPHKPFAVLTPWRGMDGLAGIRQLAEPDETECQCLRSPLRPIVLVRKRRNSPLAEAVAPGLNEVGLILPYSPLHHLLADGYEAPLVATSANLSGEPVLTENLEVEERLGGIADAYLHHNRPIRRPADDSVFRCIAGKTRPIRGGRGLAPIEITLPLRLEKPLLALGADLKNTVALAFRDRVVISPHIGDLGSLHSAEVFEDVIANLSRLYDVQPAAIICDAHPGYHSSRWALKQELPVIRVFHHHAHASALAGEHGITEPTLIFTWDGTGYGEDGTIWGGEALLGSPGQWRRVASLKPFKLIGGDRASREAWRCALSVCWELGLEWPDCPEDSTLLRLAWQAGINSPLASSAGRLFDAAAALIGITNESSYEGQAPMLLEALSQAGAEPAPVSLERNRDGLLIGNWGALIPLLMSKELSASNKGAIFHSSLTAIIEAQAIALREQYGVSKVGFSGGVFQNRLITEQARTSLQHQGFEVLLHEATPMGDGGISFGQIVEIGTRTAS